MGLTFRANNVEVMTISNNGQNSSVRGTYAFANTVGEAEAGISSAGISYIQDTNVSGSSFYTGGHPSAINERSKYPVHDYCITYINTSIHFLILCWI